MSDLLFSMFEKPLALHFPQKGIVVIEVSMSTIRDEAPTVTVQAPPAANEISLDSGEEGAPIPDPLTQKYLKDHKTWTHGAHGDLHSSEGGAGYRNVYFLNLGYVKAHLPKGQHEWQFTMHTPGNTNGTVTTGCLTAVKYFIHHYHKDPDTGEIFGPTTGFGFLPGNGFAPLVYGFTTGGATEASILSNPVILADAASSIQHDIDAIMADDPNAIDFTSETVVDFIIEEHFPHDDVLFMDIRVTTYASRKDFPVNEGSAGWPVDGADGTGRVQLFGDSGGITKLAPQTFKWTIRFPNLEVGVAKA